MSQKFHLILTILFFSILGCTKVQQKSPDFPVLSGPYLGQKPPGMIPEIFAPGIISTESFGEGGGAFARDAELFLFNRRWPPETPHSSTYMTELKDGIWTTPSPAPFNSEYPDWDYHFAPDGRTLYFTSKRPVSEAGKPSQYGHVWVTRYTAPGWTPPRMLEYPINTTDSSSIYPLQYPFIYFSEEVGNELCRPIKPHDFTFAGNKYFLIDGGCFSTTGHFLSIVKFHKLGMLIGEESGGSFACNDSSLRVTLPNTWIGVRIPMKTFSTAVTGFKKGRGIMPDHSVKPLLKDILSGEDTVLNYTLNLIKMHTNNL
jgi:hypothetical protein